MRANKTQSRSIRLARGGGPEVPAIALPPPGRDAWFYIRNCLLAPCQERPVIITGYHYTGRRQRPRGTPDTNKAGVYATPPFSSRAEGPTRGTRRSAQQACREQQRRATPWCLGLLSPLALVTSWWSGGTPRTLNRRPSSRAGLPTGEGAPRARAGHMCRPRTASGHLAATGADALRASRALPGRGG